MEKIVVRNTCIIIRDYNIGDCPKIESFFTLFDPTIHKTYYMGMEYNEEKRELYLPSAIDIGWVRAHLNEKYYERQTHHSYKMIENIKMKARPRDEEQETALRFMCGVNEYAQNKYAPQLSLCLSTGIGKTYTSIATIAFMQIKSIIITGSTTLLSQWKDEIMKFTNLTSKDIVQISGSDKIRMIMMGKSKNTDDASIYLCTHGTIRSYGDTYGWDKVYELFEYLGIGLKFYDEAHTNFDNMLRIDFHTNVYKTFYVTATPNRSNWREDRIYVNSFKNVPMIDLFDENKDPHVHYNAIMFNSRPSPQVISACKNKYGLDRMKYIDYITKSPEFYAMMRIVMQLVIDCNGRVLMYIGTNDGILRVYNWICNQYPEFIGEVGIFTSLLSKEEKLKEKRKKLLLSTTKSAGLGEHIEGLKITFVLAEPFKSEVIARQTIGRNRDPNTHYIELVDLGFVYIRRFYYSKLNIFNKYALDTSDTKIDNYELKRRVENIIASRNKGFAECPIELYDPRFNLEDYVVGKKEDHSTLECPVRFINQEEIDPWKIYQ